MIDKSDSKRIVKNTLFLYIRMGILMVVTLFTSRVLLDKLGVEDYGIYNLVGGLATMFTFFSSSLTNVTQRYLNIELGVGNIVQASKVVRQHFTLYVLICVVVVLFAETIGVWFICNKLVIPHDRISAALYVFHFMILSLCATLVGIVFDSQVIAHEDMNVYSYVGIYEGIARLVVCYMITIVPFDKLIVYAFLLFLVRISVPLFYWVYCNRRYEETSIRFLWDLSVIKGTAAMVGWNSLSTFVYAVNDTGLNVLLNLFFGTAINAARAVANQVSGAITGFTSNFYTSIRPQVTKAYAAQNWEYLYLLFYKSSKYSYFMMWILCLPVYFVADVALKIWLKEVPEYTDAFLLWILCCSLVGVLNNPVWTLALAIGKLKYYVLIGSFVSLLTLPISYVSLKLGCAPTSVFAVLFCVKMLYQVTTLKIIHSHLSFSYRHYLREVILPILKVTILSLCVALCLNHFLHGAIGFSILFVILTMLQVALVVWLVGLNAQEKAFLKRLIMNKFSLFRR